MSGRILGVCVKIYAQIHAHPGDPLVEGEKTMGTIGEHRTGYRTDVRVERRRKSKLCRTKAEAKAWIKGTEKGGIQADLLEAQEYQQAR